MTESNRIIKNSGFLTFRMILTMIITLYTSRILLRELGIDDFGIYNIVGGIVALFASLRTMFASSIQRFLNYEMGLNNFKQLQKIFSISLLIHLILSILFVLIAEPIGLWLLNNKLTIDLSRIYAASWAFQLSIFSTLITILTIPYDAVIIANERMKVYAYITILDVALKLLIIYILDWLPFDKLIAYAILISFTTVLIRLITVLYCNRTFTECKYSFFWDKKLFSKLASFAGWNFFGNSAYGLVNEGLNILLNIFSGPVANASRAIAYQIRGALIQFIMNFMTAVNPKIVKLYAQNSKNEVLKIIFAASKVSYLLLFIVVVPIYLHTNELLHIWLIEIPNKTQIFIHFILLYTLIRGFHAPLDSLFKATGNIRTYQLVDSITLFLNLPISYILLMTGSPIEIVFQIMAIIELLNWISILILAKLLNHLEIKEYIIKVVSPCLIVTVISLPLCIFISAQREILSLWSILVFDFTTILLITWVFGLSNSEKKLAIQLIKKSSTKNAIENI